MKTHSANSLFDENIKSAGHCLDMYDGINALKSEIAVDWALRAGIVFVVSALDTYFHDKIKYRVGRYSPNALPLALQKFPVPLGAFPRWIDAKRKGNVLRNLVTDYFSVRPLQSQEIIADAMKLVEIKSLWDTVAPAKDKKDEMMSTFSNLIKRRNQIAHEGDRHQSRQSGKQLRSINRDDLTSAISFAKELVEKIEDAFPA